MTYSVCCNQNFPAASPKILDASFAQILIQHKIRLRTQGYEACYCISGARVERNMLNVHIENIGEIAVLECEGRLVRSDAAFELRKAVYLQSDARIVVLDLSEVTAIESGGLGMLVFLQRWAQDHGVRFKLFNPRQSVRDRLEHASSMREFDIVTVDEIMALLACANGRYTQAA
jgi:anti-anti-sigma factor